MNRNDSEEAGQDQDEENAQKEIDKKNLKAILYDAEKLVMKIQELDPDIDRKSRMSLQIKSAVRPYVWRYP